MSLVNLPPFSLSISALAADAAGAIYIAYTGRGGRLQMPFGGQLLRVSPAGEVTTLVSDFAGDAPMALAVAGDGDIIAALFPTSGRARFIRISPAGGVSEFASVEGPAEEIAVGADGSIYFTTGHAVMKVTPDGSSSVIAGSAEPGYVDGPGDAARFRFPRGIELGSGGNLYIADLANQVIRRIDSSGIVSTLAGHPDAMTRADGAGSQALFRYPSGLAIAPSGLLYVAEPGNPLDSGAIRTVTAEGVVNTLMVVA